jgi:hypothetical protein
MDLFGRYHIINVDRRRRVQNQASNVLEHIVKHVINTIGNSASEAVVDINASIATSAFYVDNDSDGKREVADDGWIAYRHFNATDPYKVKYCANYDNASPGECADWVTIGKNIWEFNATMNYSGNYVTFNITSCWNSSETDPTKHCGSSDNPTAYMKTRVNLPSVAQH